MSSPKLTSADIAGWILSSGPRVSREVCAGPGYECMFCRRAGQPVVWEYDDDRRECYAVTCVDVEECGAAYNSRFAYEEGRRDW